MNHLKAAKISYQDQVKNTHNLLLGADPEVFVFNTVEGRYVSAHGMIPGTKDKPFKVEGGAVQVDGMALEFNIDPTNTPKDFALKVKTVLSQLKSMLPPNCVLAAKPTVEFGAEYMATVPESAKELGCDPDYSGYTNKENPRPNGKVTFRTGAGHIHIGWGEGFPIDHPEHREVCCTLARQLDYYLGVAMALIDPDKQRRELYGQRGAFRPKTYGMEYRPLSNAWLRYPELYTVIPQLVYRAWSNLQSNYPEVRRPSTVTKVFNDGVINLSCRRQIEMDTGFDIPLHPSLYAESQGAIAKVENNPFTIDFPRDALGLTNFSAAIPALTEMGVEWAAGGPPASFTDFNEEDTTVVIIDGSILRIDVKHDEKDTVDLMAHLKSEQGEKTATDIESEFFI